MKKIKNTFMAVTMLTILISGANVFATDVPRKSEDKYSDDTQKIVEIVTKDDDKEKSSSDDSEKAKATSTPKSVKKETKETETPKATKTSEASTDLEEDADKDIKKETEEKDTKENKVIVVDEEAEPSVKVSNDKELVTSKRYLTKGGAFGMFLLTVLVSAIVSFLISYRFYKMNRLNNHVMAEIRALKRDIDTKMTGTVGGFSEYETKTINNNSSYMRNGASIKHQEKDEKEENSSEMYSKWEPQLNASKPDENTLARRREYMERRTVTRKSGASAKASKDGAAAIKGVINSFFNKKK